MVGGSRVLLASRKRSSSQRKAAPQHREFPVWLNQLPKAEKIQFIQPVQFEGWSFKTQTYSELKKPENVRGFLPTCVENEAWDRGIQPL